MKVRFVLTVGGAHRPNLFAAPDDLARPHEHGVEMTEESVIRFRFATLFKLVAHDHDIAPAGVRVAGEGHLAVGNTVDRIVEIAVPAAGAIPVLPGWLLT